MGDVGVRVSKIDGWSRLAVGARGYVWCEDESTMEVAVGQLCVVEGDASKMQGWGQRGWCVCVCVVCVCKG